MKITFNKSIKVKSATVYMRLKKDVLRTDIQEYLNGRRFDNSLINNRINAYLKEIGVYNDENQITALGESVKQTGFLPTSEEGKYKIWFTSKDRYFGNVILYFHRESPYPNSLVNELDLGFSKEGHFLIPAQKDKNEENDYTQFTLTKSELCGALNQNSDTICAILILEDDKQTTCYFSGHIGKEGKIVFKQNSPVPRSDNLKEIITNILPNYEPKYDRLKIEFRPEYKDFKIKNYACNWKDFSGMIDSVKLMPYDLENAILWRDYLLREKISEKYLTPRDFETNAKEITDEDAFKKFRNQLRIPDLHFFQTKSQTEFWHLNAPIDLDPND